MRLLITGGAGCLGSNLIEHYLPQGHEVCVIDNFATGKREVLPNLPELTLVEGSIADIALLENAFEQFRPTHVIHSAAAYKDPTDWQEDIATNITGSANLALIAKRYDIVQLINFQTALCYGRPTQTPIQIDHPTAPFTSYGTSKTAGESYLLQSELPVVSLRLANICGPRLSIGPIPTFYNRLKEGKNCFCSAAIRDFLDMQDFLQLMDTLIASAPLSGTYNVSTGEGKSISDVFQTVAQYLGIEEQEPPVVPVGDDDVEVVVLDPSETEKALNWKAKVSFTDMIHKQLKWYDTYGVSSIYSHLKATQANQ